MYYTCNHLATSLMEKVLTLCIHREQSPHKACVCFSPMHTLTHFLWGGLEQKAVTNSNPTVACRCFPVCMSSGNHQLRSLIIMLKMYRRNQNLFVTKAAKGSVRVKTMTHFNIAFLCLDSAKI